MSKRSQAIAIFNAQLSVKSELGDTKFRASVIAKVMADTGSSHSSAAAMYNHAKKTAQAAGIVSEFGRKLTPAEEEAEVIKQADLEDANTPEEEFPMLDWAVVDKETRAIVDTFKSRRTAQSAKEDTETVMKTEVALDALRALDA